MGKERAGGSTGTPTKSEKVKERYMIWRERKWKVEVGKVQRRLGYPAAKVQWCIAERETPHWQRNQYSGTELEVLLLLLLLLCTF